jgi:hypothetical protein
LEDTPLDPEWRRGVGANIHQAHFSATRQTLHWLSPNPYRAEVNLVRQSVSRMCCWVLGLYVRGDIWCGVHQQSGEANCPSYQSLTPKGRVESMEKRLQVTLGAVRTVQPA